MSEIRFQSVAPFYATRGDRVLFNGTPHRVTRRVDGLAFFARRCHRRPLEWIRSTWENWVQWPIADFRAETIE